VNTGFGVKLPPLRANNNGPDPPEASTEISPIACPHPLGETDKDRISGEVALSIIIVPEEVQ
jgi:hypothetical protein